MFSQILIFLVFGPEPQSYLRSSTSLPNSVGKKIVYVQKVGASESGRQGFKSEPCGVRWITLPTSSSVIWRQRWPQCCRSSQWANTCSFLLGTDSKQHLMTAPFTELLRGHYFYHLHWLLFVFCLFLSLNHFRCVYHLPSHWDTSTALDRCAGQIHYIYTAYCTNGPTFPLF